MASMRRRPDCCLFLILTCLVVSLIFSVHASLFGDTLTVGQVMKDWDFLESSNKRFRLLFFSPESSNNLRYLGIQFINSSELINGRDQDKMVWVANRGKPLRGTLNISHDGNLMLTDYNGTFITINAEEQAVPSNDTSATLLDTGNLVLRAGKHIVWQSFDYPSDTWLPGMKLGLFKSSRGQPQHRFLTSQVSPQVPTLGAFTLGVDPNNTKQLVIWQRGVLYWRSGMWNRYNFSYFPSSNNEFNFSYFSDESQSYFTFTRTDNDFPSWIDIDSSGDIHIFKTEDGGWSSDTYYCYDSQGLEYSNNLGCVAPNPSNCTAGDVFIKKSGSTNSWGTTNNVSQGISDCKEICRQDCACTAYASALSDGSGCQFFYGEYYDSPEYIFYMRNISTANIDEIGRASIDWKIRVSIIEGIAQGLQYLHKYSRVRIIHRDLKTSNILLDNNMNPKISDFGTARIFGDNESRANTNRIVGTYGYMSPEYALDGLFSVKSDVFSFGIMMLEIISGKKNTGFYQPDRAQNLLGYAWDLWKEGRGLEIIDHLFVETCSTSEVMRYIQVSFLCVQENAADRPTISDVVSMLSNEIIAIPAPKQPAFSTIVSVKYGNTLEIPKLCSVNDVTISEAEGR